MHEFYFVTFVACVGHHHCGCLHPRTAIGAMGDGTHGEDGVLYFGTLGPWVFAVNATTGAVIWRSGGGVPAEYVLASLPLIFPSWPNRVSFGQK